MKTQSLHLIPMPKNARALGTHARLEMSIRSFSPRYDLAKDSFTDLALKVHQVKITNGDGITLIEDTSLASSEYRLLAQGGKVNIYASDEDGMSCALSTLLQLIDKRKDGLYIPDVEIADNPDCEYRTLMIDLARKWHPFDTLLGYVDLCYLYKIKFLHLHFIDTQSYTLPSVKFPKMPTEGRHYTREQISELNEYARKRNIEIIPEMEVPGHAKSMVTAYPELFADSPIGESKTDDYSLFFANIKNNIICVGKPGIMDTLRTITQEIIDMFPYSRYLHIGGDEAAIGEWNNCKECLRYMEENRIDGVKPLYTEFIKRMTDMVLELGKTPIVWEGFPREGSDEISRKVIVTAWESYYHLAPELVEEGFNITNASWQPLYCVPKEHRVVPDGRWSQREVLDWNIYTWRNWNKKTAAYESPIIIEPTPQVLGATFCAWEDCYECEIIPVRENLAAMSEKVWNINSTLSYEEFSTSFNHTDAMARKLTV